MTIPTILKTIIDRKWEEVAERKRKRSLASLLNDTQDAGYARGFVDAIRQKVISRKAAVIAEIKKASPSKGVIREDFDPKAIAQSYEQGGACCLSILTDKDFFQGDERYLMDARAATQLPVIRKDFLVDAYQIAEARALQADCVLLIVAALEGDQLRDLNQQAQELGMDVLIEVHDAYELEVALREPNKLIGINNRNLHTFDVSLQTTFDLLKEIPDDRIVVTESGILEPEHVNAMLEKEIYGFLVGESFMRAQNPGRKLAELFQI